MDKVTVYKDIWSNGEFTRPNPALANLYSLKTIGQIAHRSIWDVEPVERYIPPADFHERLLAMIGDRVEYGEKIKEIGNKWLTGSNGGLLRRGEGAPIISTIPLQAMARIIDPTPGVGELDHTPAFRPIWVYKGKIIGQAYQTIYLPDQNTSAYRLSVTGNEFIIESMATLSDAEIGNLLAVISISEYYGVHCHKQTVGKMVPIPENYRRNFILQSTINHRIYALGRFATWREKVMMDDVVKDLAMIRHMINHDHYELVRKESANES
jgi:hypothetical protein